jgi:hypothetical protein
MSDKISPRKLREMLIDPNVPEDDLKQYLDVDQELSTAFKPRFRSNPDLVQTETMDAGGFLGDINNLARQRRQRKYREKLTNGFNGLRIVSEGDSWFQFPILLQDVIDQLFNEYAIFSLDAAGDTLVNIVEADEITHAIAEEKPSVFLISGGGNDMVADQRLRTLLHSYDSSLNAEDYLNESFDEYLSEIKGLYRDLFSRLSAKFPTLRILYHGYDYVIPKNFISLGRPMASIGITDPQLQKDIMKVIIDRTNDFQINLVSEFVNVYHVDCRNSVGPEQWFDELHPRNAGFASVAGRFRDVIQHL